MGWGGGSWTVFPWCLTKFDRWCYLCLWSELVVTFEIGGLKCDQSRISLVTLGRSSDQILCHLQIEGKKRDQPISPRYLQRGQSRALRRNEYTHICHEYKWKPIWTNKAFFRIGLTRSICSFKLWQRKICQFETHFSLSRGMVSWNFSKPFEANVVPKYLQEIAGK